MERVRRGSNRGQNVNVLISLGVNLIFSLGVPFGRVTVSVPRMSTPPPAPLAPALFSLAGRRALITGSG